MLYQRRMNVKYKIYCEPDDLKSAADLVKTPSLL